MRVALSSEIGPFLGSPTPVAIRAALQGIPDEAEIRFEQWDSQRDGDGWRIRASWSEER